MPNFAEALHRKSILGLLVLVFLCLLVYLRVLNAPFIFDDSITITHNPIIRNFTSAMADLSNNRYVGMLTFAANYAAGGLTPFGYHLLNVLIHASNVLLVYVFVSLIYKTPALPRAQANARHIAFAAALLFAVHPIHTQAVSYVAQRFTSLTTFFYLVALVLYMKMRFVQISEQRTLSSASLMYYVPSLVTALLALKTKEISVTLPGAILLCELAFFTREKRLGWRYIQIVPYALCLLIFPLTSFSAASMSSVSTLVEDVDRFTKDDMVPFGRMEYLVTQFKVIVLYLRLLVLPVKQIFDYDYPVARAFFVPGVFLSFVLLLSLFVAGVFAIRRHRILGFTIFWFFLTISVESSIIPIRDIANEHRLYLPSVGFFVLVASSIDSVFREARTKVLVIATIVSVLSVMTVTRNELWRDPAAMWQDVIDKAPHNARAYGSLGIIYKKDKQYDKALALLEKTKSLGKAYPEVFLHLGDIYYEMGDFPKALMHLEVAEKIDTTSKVRLSVLNKLGRTHEKLGASAAAINAFQQAIQRYPKSTTPYNNLAVLYIRQKQYDKAIEILQAALRNYEADYLYKNLIEAYRRKGDDKKAEETMMQYQAFMGKMQSRGQPR